MFIAIALLLSMDPEAAYIPERDPRYDAGDIYIPDGWRPDPPQKPLPTYEEWRKSHPTYEEWVESYTERKNGRD